MNLSLFSLRVFLNVAERGSFTRAAEDLFLSQPAVSLQIQKIEQLFQTPLFVRNHSGYIRLTAAGETLQKHARELMRLQQAILADMTRHSPALERELRIGTCCIAGEHLVPLGLSAFRESHPECQVALSIIKCEQVFRSLLSGELDIGVTGLAPRSKSLDKKKLTRVPLLLFGSKAAQAVDVITDLKGLRNSRLIMREKGAGCRVEFEKFLTKHNMRLKEFSVTTESDSNEAIKKLVSEGYGLSVLPEFMIRKDIRDGVFSEIQLKEGQPKQTFYVSYRNQDNPSQIKEELITLLMKSSLQKAAKDD